MILNKKSRLECEMMEGYLAMVRDKVFLGRRVELEEVGVVGGIEGSSESIMPLSEQEMSKVLTSIRDVILQ